MRWISSLGLAFALAHAACAQETNIELQTDLAFSSLAAKDYAHALEQFRNVLAQQPLLVHARYGLGVTLKEMKNFTEAVPALEDAVEMDSTNVDYRVDLAYAVLGEGGPKARERAEQIFLNALKIDPEQPRANYLAGVFYEDWQKPEMAVPYFEKAVSLGYDDPKAKLFLGENYLKLGRRADAEALLKALVDTYPAGDELHDRAEAALAAP